MIGAMIVKLVAERNFKNLPVDLSKCVGVEKGNFTYETLEFSSIRFKDKDTVGSEWIYGSKKDRDTWFDIVREVNSEVDSSAGIKLIDYKC